MWVSWGSPGPSWRRCWRPSWGIRAYAELKLLAEQSDTMLKAMRAAEVRILQLDPAAPLASQALGNALAPVATLMLEDLEGWAWLLRAKVMDP